MEKRMESKSNENKKRICIGILAHVDAGKTTLSEAMLYASHAIRTRGRVDHQNTFLDYDLQERQRGITIYLKQAVFTWNNTEFTLLDTPGHTDFSAEMERTLEVLDAAIVLISASDKVQAHTRTIWKLLESYHIPTFIFVNKMDLAHQDKTALINELQSQLSERCLDFAEKDRDEAAAMLDDTLLESYLDYGRLSFEALSSAVFKRKIFFCWFGSALKQTGIEDFLNGLESLLPPLSYPKEFGAKVFKISRDPQGNRLTHVKITGGALKARESVNGEKIDQIRIYSGNKFIMVSEAKAGTICSLKGPKSLQIHDGLGFEGRGRSPVLNGCLSYRLRLLNHEDEFQVFRQLKTLEEENPELHLSYLSQQKEIRMELLGEIQTEILKQIIADRFSLQVEFDEGSISYKETIQRAVEGIGHYEPLRHYAEVHLLLEPAPPGSGLQIESACSQDILEAHWQKLILSTLDTQRLTGVLTNSPLTDMKITLLSGKAHPKHTDGQDFAQAALRALRQGLRSTESLLLEPIYQFEMEIPAEALSRALFDLETRHAEVKIETLENTIRLTGTVPVSAMQNYSSELRAYTKGQGRLSCLLKGYASCLNSDEIIAQIGYQCQSDLEHPADSIFCAHGSGFLVKWNEVENYMHLEKAWQPEKAPSSGPSFQRHKVNDEELQAVMARTYKQKERIVTTRRTVKKELPEHIEVKKTEKKTDCLLVDGYNMIHSWEATKALAEEDLAAARDKLIGMLMNYHGTIQGILIIVFDAWKIKENPGSITKQDNAYIIYTKTAETADSYIEKATHTLAKKYRVTVATSDGMEQRIILGQGALRLSARELLLRIEKNTRQNRKQENKPIVGHRPMEKLKEYIEKE